MFKDRKMSKHTLEMSSGSALTGETPAAIKLLYQAAFTPPPAAAASGPAGQCVLNTCSGTSNNSYSLQNVPNFELYYRTNVTMPALSPTMAYGTIIKWLKKEGDIIEAGDAVADIQTDKGVMTFEAEDEAVLAKILAPEGLQTEVGDLIAIIVKKKIDVSNIIVPTTKKGAASAPVPAITASAAVVSAAGAPSGAKESTPPTGKVYGEVKRLLEEDGLS